MEEEYREISQCREKHAQPGDEAQEEDEAGVEEECREISQWREDGAHAEREEGQRVRKEEGVLELQEVVEEDDWWWKRMQKKDRLESIDKCR